MKFQIPPETSKKRILRVSQFLQVVSQGQWWWYRNEKRPEKCCKKTEKKAVKSYENTGKIWVFDTTCEKICNTTSNF